MAQVTSRVGAYAPATRITTTVQKTRQVLDRPKYEQYVKQEETTTKQRIGEVKRKELAEATQQSQTRQKRYATVGRALKTPKQDFLKDIQGYEQEAKRDIVRQSQNLYTQLQTKLDTAFISPEFQKTETYFEDSVSTSSGRTGYLPTVKTSTPAKESKFVYVSGTGFVNREFQEFLTKQESKTLTSEQRKLLSGQPFSQDIMKAAEDSNATRGYANTVEAKIAQLYNQDIKQKRGELDKVLATGDLKESYEAINAFNLNIKKSNSRIEYMYEKKRVRTGLGLFPSLEVTKKSNTPTFQKYPNGSSDITQTEFKQRLGSIYSNIESQTRPQDLIIGLDTRRQKIQQKADIGAYPYGEFGEFIGGSLESGGEAFDFSTDVLGYGVSLFTPKRILIGSKERFVTRETERARLSKEFKGIKNPYEALLMKYEGGGSKKFIEEIQSDFFLSKQVGESALFLAGGVPLKLATIGSIARAKRPEEVILPLALGAGVRMFTPLIGSRATASIASTNKKLDAYFSKMFTSKLPVPKNVLVPSPYANLISPSKLAKSLVFGGVAIETAGISFVPLGQKREYIRQVGLYNALVPLGYKAADVGIPLGKFAGIKAISGGSKVIGKLSKKDLTPFDIYDYKELMYPELAEKFGRTGGGTPMFKGNEKDMLALAQGTDDYGVGAVYKKFGVDPKELGIGAGIRSIGNQPLDFEIAGRNYYETMFDYYSDVLHPIALSNVGFKNRLLRKPANLFYDEFSLSPAQPNIKFTVAGRGSAVNLFPDQPLNYEKYLSLNEFFGYKNMDFSFSEDVLFKKVKIPKGKTLTQFEFEKIQQGGRPIKTGDFLNAGFSDEVFDAFVKKENSMFQDIQGFVSSRPRAYGVTGEREFGIPMGVPDVRAAPLTKTRGFFRKLGFSDFYVDVGFEYVPGTYRQVPPKNLLMLNSGQKLLEPVKIEGQRRLTGTDQTFFQSESLVKSNKGLISQQNFLAIQGTGKGGYTKELEKLFGTRQKPIVNFFSRAVYPKPTVDLLFSRPSKTKTYKSSDTYYDFSQSYKEPKYKPISNIYRMPKPIRAAVPKYVPDRTPDYFPARTPDYTPQRYPDYRTPTYKPIKYPEYRTPNITRMPIIKRTSIKIPTGVGMPIIELKGSGKEKLYKTQVRLGKKAKWKTLEGSAPKNRAYNKGFFEADNTIQQSVQIVPSGTSKQVIDDPFLQDFKFGRRARKSKIKGKNPIYVEKRKFAIDTLGEKQKLKSTRQLGRLAWAF